MTPIWWHLLAVLAAGLGAAARAVIDGAVTAAQQRAVAARSGQGKLSRQGRAGAVFPWGITVVNLSGALIVGLCAGLLAAGALHVGTVVVDSWQLSVALGFTGGYTTFSTASYQTVQLVQQRRWVAAAAQSVGQLTVAVALVAIGWWGASIVLLVVA